VVLPDPRAHRRPSQGPWACLGLTICLVIFPLPGTSAVNNSVCC
jgi:hypothetical protein